MKNEEIIISDILLCTSDPISWISSNTEEKNKVEIKVSHFQLTQSHEQYGNHKLLKSYYDSYSF